MNDAKPLSRAVLMHPLALAVVMTLSVTPQAEVRPAPIFLVLKTGVTPTQTARETKLHDEVSLLLDDFAVFSQPIDDAQFQNRPLAQQLKSVLEIAKLNDALGALWLAEPSRGQLMVHVVGMGTGRALIRTLEFDQRSGSEKALALIVRELLGTAFLQAAPEHIDPSLAEVVRGVRRELPKDPTLEPKAKVDLPPEAPPAMYSLSGAVVSSLALVGGAGRWATLGAQVRVERAFGELLRLGLELELHGARDFSTAAAVSSLEVPLGVTASLHWRTGAFVLMPRLSVLGGVSPVWATTAEGSTSALVATVRARAAMGVRAQATGPLQLMLEVSLDAVPLRGEVRESLTGEQLWRAPILELRGAAGFFWEG